MYRFFILINSIIILVGCVGTPTPSQIDYYYETLEAEEAIIDKYFNCKTTINEQFDLVENTAVACSKNYDCRAEISKQLREIIEKYKTTCSPIPSGNSSKHNCNIKLLEARAAFVHGAPNESGINKIRAEEQLGKQVEEAYEYCIFLFSP